MGAVRIGAQTADKSITIIHSTPVHQLTSAEDKRLLISVTIISVIMDYFEFAFIFIFSVFIFFFAVF